MLPMLGMVRKRSDESTNFDALREWNGRANPRSRAGRVGPRVGPLDVSTARSRDESRDVVNARDIARVSRDRAKNRDFAKKVLSRVFVKKSKEISTFCTVRL